MTKLWNKFTAWLSGWPEGTKEAKKIKEDEELKIPDSFIWVTLYQIKQLMKIENFVGPHVRGIISYL